MIKYGDFTILPALEHKDGLRELFAEYTQMLVDNDPVFASYLELQNYDDEIENLERKYAPPSGRMFIVFRGSELCGCGGLMRYDDDACELKRMYVRPEFRGRGLASFLGRLILDEAKNAGYSYVLLDTLPFLQSAQRLYRRLGFYEIEKYNDSPMENATYMRYDLR